MMISITLLDFSSADIIEIRNAVISGLIVLLLPGLMSVVFVKTIKRALKPIVNTADTSADTTNTETNNVNQNSGVIPFQVKNFLKLRRAVKYGISLVLLVFLAFVPVSTVWLYAFGLCWFSLSVWLVLDAFEFIFVFLGFMLDHAKSELKL